MYRRVNQQSHLLAKTQVEVGYQLCMLRTHDCAVVHSCHNSEHSNVVRERRIDGGKGPGACRRQPAVRQSW